MAGKNIRHHSGIGKNGRSYMIDIILDQNRCQGSKCAKCAYVCPNNVFTVNCDIITVTSPVYCKMCQECLEICPEAAISLNIPDNFPNISYND